MTLIQPVKPGKPLRMPSQAAGLDITAFVLAFLLPLVGVILGFAGIHEAHKAGRQASGLAVAAAIIGSLATVVVIAVIVAAANAASNASDPVNQFINCVNGQVNGTVPASTDCSQYMNNG